jgi:hypothetical protein
MSVTAANLVQGPATIYYGAFGATEPLDTAVDTAPSDAVWTDVGGTTDGVKISIDQKYSSMDVDQVVDIVESRLVSREITIETKMAEATLDNLALLLNGGTQATGSGYESLTLADTGAGESPTYHALVIDGLGPNGVRRRIIIRKVLQVDGVNLDYTKDKQTVYSVKMRAHYVSASVKPVKIVDEAAGS